MKTIEMANYYKVLGDENRLIILKALYCTEEICACNFLKFVNCGQATLSHHLSVLQNSGLVKARRDGKKILYACNKKLLKDIMHYLEE